MLRRSVYICGPKNVHKNFHSYIIIIYHRPNCKQSKCSLMVERIKTLCYVPIIEYHLAMEKKKQTSVVSNTISKPWIIEGRHKRVHIV